MFEFHGWILINLASEGQKEDPLTTRINAIKNVIDELSTSQSKVDIFYQQGKPFIRFDGRLNHYEGWVLKLFFAINKMTDGSEGILFIKDEDNPCLNSQFRVWQMMNGEVLSGDMTFFPDKYNSHHNNLQIA